MLNRRKFIKQSVIITSGTSDAPNAMPENTMSFYLNELSELLEELPQPDRWLILTESSIISDVMYGTLGDGKILKTIDGGLTWFEIEGGTI